MAWSEVNTRDAKKASEFYAKVFELSPQVMEDAPSEYYMLNQSGAPAAGVNQMTAEWGEAPAHWMPYFAVANLTSAIGRVKSGGGTVLQGPFDSPYGQIAIIADPQGATFSIIELSENPPA